MNSFFIFASFFFFSGTSGVEKNLNLLSFHFGQKETHAHTLNCCIQNCPATKPECCSLTSWRNLYCFACMLVCVGGVLGENGQRGGGVYIGFDGLGIKCTQARGRKRPQHNIRTEEEEAKKKKTSRIKGLIFFYIYIFRNWEKRLRFRLASHSHPTKFFPSRLPYGERSEDDETTRSSVIEKILLCWTVYSKYLDYIFFSI